MEALEVQKAVFATRESVHARNHGVLQAQQTAHNLGNVHYSLAQIHKALNHNSEALRHAREAAANQAKVPYPKELAAALILQAELEQREGSPADATRQRAESILRKLLETNPRSLQLKRLLAQARQGHSEQH